VHERGAEMLFRIPFQERFVLLEKGSRW